MRKTLGRVKGRTRKNRKSRRVRKSRIYGGVITTNVIKPKPKQPPPTPGQDPTKPFNHATLNPTPPGGGFW